MMGALAKANVNIKAIAQGSSEYNITVLIDQADSERALRAVHSRFYLSDVPIGVGVVGPGLIGSALLAQLREQAAQLRKEFGIDLRVLGVASSRHMLLRETGVDLEHWKEEMEQRVGRGAGLMCGPRPCGHCKGGKELGGGAWRAGGCCCTPPASRFRPCLRPRPPQSERTDLDKFGAFLASHYIPNRVIVDCTASDAPAAKYLGWMQQGIHVVTPNKKLGSGALEQYLAVRRVQREGYIHFFYEAS
jgi:aspartokinase/homoserine dehydrogenase 1